MKKSYVYGILFALLSLTLFVLAFGKISLNYNFILMVSFVSATIICFCISFFEELFDTWKAILDNRWWREALVGASHTVAFWILYWSFGINAQMNRMDSEMEFLRTMMGNKEIFLDPFPFELIIGLFFWITFCNMFLRLLKANYSHRKNTPWNKAKWKVNKKEPIDDFTTNEYLWRIVVTFSSAIFVSFFIVPLICMLATAILFLIVSLVLSLVMIALPKAPKYFKLLCVIGFFAGGIIAFLAKDYPRENSLQTLIRIWLGAWAGFFIAQTAIVLGKMTVVKKTSLYLTEKFYK